MVHCFLLPQSSFHICLFGTECHNSTIFDSSTPMRFYGVRIRLCLWLEYFQGSVNAFVVLSNFFLPLFYEHDDGFMKALPTHAGRWRCLFSRQLMEALKFVGFVNRIMFASPVHMVDHVYVCAAVYAGLFFYRIYCICITRKVCALEE